MEIRIKSKDSFGDWNPSKWESDGIPIIEELFGSMGSIEFDETLQKFTLNGRVYRVWMWDYDAYDSVDLTDVGTGPQDFVIHLVKGVGVFQVKF